MKRTIVWIFVLQFATGHNLLVELVRISSLAEHYQTHRRETPDLSFAGFLWLHYLETAHSHPDNSHAKLPFHCSHGMMAESVLPQPQVVEFVPFSISAVHRNLPLFDEDFSPNDYSFGLLRPPIA